MEPIRCRYFVTRRWTVWFGPGEVSGKAAKGVDEATHDRARGRCHALQQQTTDLTTLVSFKEVRCESC